MDFELSDSDGSSSTDSKTTKRTISAEIVQLGERPIARTVCKQTLLSAPCQLFPALTFLVEIYYLNKYANSNNVAKYSFMVPFVMILVREIPNSLAQYGASQAYKNIGTQQYTAANIYFAYYFLVAAAYAVVVLALDFLVLKRFYADESSGIFFIIEFAVMPLLHSLTFALDKFWEVENRLGLVCCKSVLHFGVVGGLTPVMYNYFSGFYIKNNTTLNHFAIVYLIAYVVQLFWSVFVVLRADVFSVQYFGVLKFSSRRLRPFRARFLWTFFVKSIPNMLINCAFFLSALVISLVLYHIPTTDYELNLLFVRNLLVIAVRELLQALHRSFGKSLYLTCQYNISVKKLSRAFQFLKMHVLFDSIVCIPVCLLFIPLARPLAVFLQPQVRNLRRDAAYEISNSYPAAMIVAAVMSVAFLAQTVTVFNEIEGNLRGSCLLQIPSLLYAGAVPFLCLLIVGETVPCSQVLALGEIVNAVVALPFVVYLFLKYKQLEKMEFQKQEQEQKLKEKQLQNDEIRATVSQAFDADIEAEDSRTARQNVKLMRDVRLSMTAREKSERLNNSMVFQGLARQFDSMDRWGSIVRKSTTDMGPISSRFSYNASKEFK